MSPVPVTNQDLKQRIEAGLFRENLYCRLNVFPIEPIPLRQRHEDIPMLTQHFIHSFSLAGSGANKNLLKVSLADLERLSHYHWPGNIRELEMCSKGQ